MSLKRIVSSYSVYMQSSKENLFLKRVAWKVICLLHLFRGDMIFYLCRFFVVLFDFKLILNFKTFIIVWLLKYYKDYNSLSIIYIVFVFLHRKSPDLNCFLISLQKYRPMIILQKNNYRYFLSPSEGGGI